MDWETYSENYRKLAQRNSVSNERVEELLIYAHKLFNQGLPIIYDQHHFCLLLGICDEYLHRMSNNPSYFYRTFFIPKKNGNKRRIDEPLPDLKRVQRWILTEILYKVPCSTYAKAYIPQNSIKNNIRFHRGQKIILAIDIKNYFPSLKAGKVLNLFLSFGYTLPISVLLTHLCCLNNSLPQGAPTSAYLSNLLMYRFDEIIGNYVVTRKIRYTRYADDMTFSGDFNIMNVLMIVDRELRYLGLSRNKRKFKVMRSNDSQKVTGIILNKKVQLPREYRMKIRQEIYYIKKFGLDSHLLHTNQVKANYLTHLKGQIQYCLFINPKDRRMKQYLQVIAEYE